MAANLRGLRPISAAAERPLPTPRTSFFLLVFLCHCGPERRRHVSRKRLAKHRATRLIAETAELYGFTFRPPECSKVQAPNFGPPGYRLHILSFVTIHGSPQPCSLRRAVLFATIYYCDTVSGPGNRTAIVVRRHELDRMVAFIFEVHECREETSRGRSPDPLPYVQSVFARPSPFGVLLRSN